MMGIISQWLYPAYIRVTSSFNCLYKFEISQSHIPVHFIRIVPAYPGPKDRQSKIEERGYYYRRDFEYETGHADL